MKRLTLAIVLLASACGFVPSDPFGSRTTAGEAAFTDDHTVELCENGAHFGLLANPAVGFCGLDKATLPTCKNDGDCGSRERCLCGGCVVAPCDSNDECGEQRVCDFNDRRCDRSCAVDGDCAKHEICLPGRAVCRGVCNSDGDCQHGETCDSAKQRCVATACGGDDDCGGVMCGVLRVPAEVGEPAIVVDASGNLELWFERREMSGSTIWRAQSIGGATDRFAIAPDQALATGGAPSVIVTPNGYDLVWQDVDVLQAASVTSDGSVGAITMLGTSTDGVAPTHTLSSTGMRHVLVARADGSAIVSLDDGSEIVDVTAYVAPPYVLAATSVGSPFLEVAPGVTRLWSTLNAVETGPSRQFDSMMPTPTNDSVALAVSDGVGPLQPFSYNPVLANVESLTMHPWERAPTTLVWHNVRYLYYERRGLDGQTAENLRVAHTP